MKDPFREEYQELDKSTKDTICIFKSIAEDLYSEFELAEVDPTIDKRCMALAKTNLEQAIMWAVKSIT